MSKSINAWEAILSQYKDSNLSQKDFCKEKGLSWNKFRYRWDRHNLSNKNHEEPLVLKNHPAKVSFEPVSIISSCQSKEEMTINEVSIHLPNRIRCDIKINLKANQLTTLLKQLVTLC